MDADSSPLSSPTCWPLVRMPGLHHSKGEKQKGRWPHSLETTYQREFRASFVLFFYVTHKEANQHPVNATLTPLRGCSVEISLCYHLRNLRHLGDTPLSVFLRNFLREFSLRWEDLSWGWGACHGLESQTEQKWEKEKARWMPGFCALSSLSSEMWGILALYSQHHESYFCPHNGGPSPILPTPWIMPSSPWRSPSPILPTRWIMPLSPWWGSHLKLWDRTSASPMELFC